MLLMVKMMMMMMMGAMMLRVQRILVTMMKIRTCLHKEGSNVFLNIKFVPFNNNRQQILNW